MNKYNAKKTVIDGITFDSKREAKRYAELKLRLQAGEITDLYLQPVYLLQESFDKDDHHFRAIHYKADFEYKENGKTIVEDSKGFKTDVYKIKRKLFEKVFPDKTIREV